MTPQKVRTLSLRMLSTEQAEQAAKFFQEMIKGNYKLVTGHQCGQTHEESTGRFSGPGLGLYLKFELDCVRSKEELIKQLEAARDEQKRIGKDVEPGSGAWRMQSGYINGLLFALGEGPE